MNGEIDIHGNKEESGLGAAATIDIDDLSYRNPTVYGVSRYQPRR